jgi:plasmid stabilization system protein ParE
MRVLLTPEAATLLESRKSWWRANRPATAELFEQEFLDAVTLIADRPELFPVALKTRGRTVHRVLMEKTSCHLYYEIDQAAGVVRIVSAWGAVRGKPPRL